MSINSSDDGIHSALISSPLPAARPTTKRTGRAGSSSAAAKCGSAGTAAALPASCRQRRRAKLMATLGALRQFGNQLQRFGLGPRPHGARAHIAPGGYRHGEFGDRAVVRRFDDGEQIGIAGSQISRLDIDAHFLAELAGGLGAFGRFLDRTDALFGPVQRQDECRHEILPFVACDCRCGGVITLHRGSPPRKGRTVAPYLAMLHYSLAGSGARFPQARNCLNMDAPDQESKHVVASRARAWPPPRSSPPWPQPRAGHVRNRFRHRYGSQYRAGDRSSDLRRVGAFHGAARRCRPQCRRRAGAGIGLGQPRHFAKTSDPPLYLCLPLGSIIAALINATILLVVTGAIAWAAI